MWSEWETRVGSGRELPRGREVERRVAGAVAPHQRDFRAPGGCGRGLADAVAVRIDGDGRRFLIVLRSLTLQGDPVLQLLIVRESGVGSEGRERGGDEGEFGDGLHLAFVSFRNR